MPRLRRAMVQAYTIPTSAHGPTRNGLKHGKGRTSGLDIESTGQLLQGCSKGKQWRSPSAPKSQEGLGAELGSFKVHHTQGDISSSTATIRSELQCRQSQECQGLAHMNHTLTYTHTPSDPIMSRLDVHLTNLSKLPRYTYT